MVGEPAQFTVPRVIPVSNTYHSDDHLQKFDGASLSWKTKFNEPSVKSLSASYSHKVGPSLLYEVEPSSKTELGVKVFTRTQTFKGEVTYKPEDVNKYDAAYIPIPSIV